MWACSSKCVECALLLLLHAICGASRFSPRRQEQEQDLPAALLETLLARPVVRLMFARYHDNIMTAQKRRACGELWIHTHTRPPARSLAGSASNAHRRQAKATRSSTVQIKNKRCSIFNREHTRPHQRYYIMLPAASQQPEKFRPLPFVEHTPLPQHHFSIAQITTLWFAKKTINAENSATGKEKIHFVPSRQFCFKKNIFDELKQILQYLHNIIVNLSLVCRGLLRQQFEKLRNTNQDKPRINFPTEHVL
jgi:hypothetical protein